MRSRIVVVLAAAAAGTPLLLSVAVSFMSPTQFARDGIGLPAPFTLENYAELLAEPRGIALSLLTTAAVAVVVAVVQTVSSVLAAYALACLAMPGRRIVGAVLLAAYAVPPVITVIPLYIGFVRAGLSGTFWALAIPFVLSSPYAVFLLVQWMRSVPRELLDAAAVDGAGPGRVLREIVVPIVRPAIATVALVAAVSVWNSYLWPRLIAGVQLPQIQVAVASLQTQYDSNWTLTMAAVVLAVLPPVAATLLLHRSLTHSLEEAPAR